MLIFLGESAYCFENTLINNKTFYENIRNIQLLGQQPLYSITVSGTGQSVQLWVDIESDHRTLAVGAEGVPQMPHQFLSHLEKMSHLLTFDSAPNCSHIVPNNQCQLAIFFEEINLRYNRFMKHTERTGGENSCSIIHLNPQPPNTSCSELRDWSN